MRCATEGSRSTSLAGLVDQKGSKPVIKRHKACNLFDRRPGITSVAVVGNGPISAQQRQEINSHCLVLRSALTQKRHEHKLVSNIVQILCWPLLFYSAQGICLFSCLFQDLLRLMQVQFPKQHVARGGARRHLGRPL